MPPCSHSLCWLQLLSHLLCVSDMQAIASSGWAQLCSPTFGLLMLSSHCSSSTPDFPGGSYVTAGQRVPVRQGAAVLLVRRPSAPFATTIWNPFTPALLTASMTCWGCGNANRGLVACAASLFLALGTSQYLQRLTQATLCRRVQHWLWISAAEE
jgi:hypothetical protein